MVQHYYCLDYVYEQWMCLDVTVDIETVTIDEQSPICNYSLRQMCWLPNHEVRDSDEAELSCNGVVD